MTSDLDAKYPPLDEAQMALPQVRLPGEVLPGEVKQVFDYWVLKTWSGKGVHPVLSEKRRSLIQRCIKTYGYDAALAVVDGVVASDWHMGANPRGKRYVGIELIYRDAQHIEDFIEMAEDDVAEPF